METGILKNEENYKALKIKLNNKTETCKKAILNCMKGAEEIYVKVLLVLVCCIDNNSNENDGSERFNIEIGIDCLTGYISDKNKIEEEKIFRALDFWRSKKILEYSPLNISRDLYSGKIDTGEVHTDEAWINTEKPATQNRNEPIDKISETLETKSEFRRLIHDGQQKFKTIFNPNELSILLNLYEINKIEINLLCKVIDMCVIENKPNVKYLEKIALGLVSNGVLTAEEYERNYNEILKIKEYEKRVSQIFNLGERKFTSSEKTYIKRWATEFEFSDEILQESYNICIEKLKELKFGYINGILANWHAKGFSAVADIRDEFKNNAGASVSDSRASSFNIEQFFAKAVERAMSSDD